MGALALRAVCETQDAKVMGLQCLPETCQRIPEGDQTSVTPLFR